MGPGNHRRHLAHAPGNVLFLSHPGQYRRHRLRFDSQLEENVQLAREFTPLSDKQRAELVERATPVSKQSLFFRFEQNRV